MLIISIAAITAIVLGPCWAAIGIWKKWEFMWSTNEIVTDNPLPPGSQTITLLKETSCLSP